MTEVCQYCKGSGIFKFNLKEAPPWFNIYNTIAVYEDGLEPERVPVEYLIYTGLKGMKREASHWEKNANVRTSYPLTLSRKPRTL